MLQHITDHQGQAHPALFELERLEAFVHRHILGQQLAAERRQRRPQGQGAAEVGAGQGVFFDADEMQPRIGRGALGKQLPGAEEIQAGAEAGFADHQALARPQRAETLAQVVLVDEHMTGFLQALVLGEIDVVVLARVRSALVIPVDLGVLGYFGHVRLSIGKRAILADRRQAV
ncbi:hypothetical protein D3C80_1309740 [compost metagenome]